MAHRLMCITAHPDDESAAFGGALLIANETGVETTVICLTEGQAASNRGDAVNGDELAQLRRAEFAAASETLGVTRGEVLHYPDGKLARHDIAELIGTLVERIRQWRPHVVLTFGGEGGVNLHRDHTVVSLAATVAFHWAGRSIAYPEHLDRGMQVYWPQKLYYVSSTFLTTRNDEDRTNTSHTPYSLELVLGDRIDRKFEAFRRHTTQAIILDRAEPHMLEGMAIERYLLVAARGFHKSGSEDSMFAGIADD